MYSYFNSQKKITDNINENQFYIVSFQLSRETYFNFLIEIDSKGITHMWILETLWVEPIYQSE